MGLTGLEIFKLTPRTNCKECGFPTCMAFSMKVASGAVEIEKCPYISDEAKEKLSDATAPPMKTFVIGKGEAERKIGGETVLYRHEKTLVNKPVVAIGFDDTMDDAVVDGKIANIKKVDYERIGEQMNAEAVLVKCVENKEAFLALIDKLSPLNKVVLIQTKDADIAKEALEKVKDTNPVLLGANKDNIDGFVELAKAYKIALGLEADTLENLYDLVQVAEKAGHKELILNTTGKNAGEAFESTVEVRRAAITGGDRTFGYPSIVMVNEIAGGDAYMETALASAFVLRYGSIIVLSDLEYSKALPLFGLRQNIYTDPQKPMRVEPKVYNFGSPKEDSPVLLTVDFALTYFVVSGEIDRSKAPAYLLIPDAGGYSVLTSWAAGKLGGSVIRNAVKESGLEEKLTKKRLVLPGKVAVLKGDVEEELPGWEIIVGPDEAMQIPKFLKELA
ncbi:acetyl-CoA decarbonylase/synthase complex subunit gamma [Alkalibacter rhizosphaerae]|uniref:Acetyl-CoA decarbonylase/synthase complex subunit gamma n=1 Tax=Alkalibacter rhizosphaerae TaxID=2815577 RepID=A0A975AIB1_9FIRM|nr:acetyl-CoA decarbonylase/synthase complex subunit gamma [Alkalibacter rhizosphaerae]QSX08350.1 acetyl-CoA decarbonylase/synthase complex subunit gamma [Alkalibacter rhizosphaerae]